MKRFSAAALLVGLLAVATGLAQDRSARRRARIETARMGELSLRFVDAAGQPLEGVEVEAVQTSSDFRFGCNIYLWGRVESPAGEKAYRQRFCQVFNYATLPFYWWVYEPEPGRTQAKRIEQIAAWCRAHGITPKGHPLLWNWEDPAWLPDDVDEIKQLSFDRVERCVQSFAGRIDVWDVVNEAVHFDRPRLLAKKQTRMWSKVGRVALVRTALERARKANPRATLLVNDYRTDDAYVRLIKSLRNEDGSFPFDVIGIQSHMHGGAWSTAQVRDVCDRFAQFGLPLHFTELTILSGETGWERPKPWRSTPQGERRQAQDVERIYSELFAHPAVEAITWWDFTDQAAWQGAPAGLLRADMTPKPAYEVLERLITKQWRSRVNGRSAADGRLAQRVFRGDYAVTWRSGDASGSSSVTVGKTKGTPIEIKLPAAD
jgi:GH35 family endo-1,4-beta-xylanase